MKRWHDFFLQYLFHINQDIPTTDQVHIGKGRINGYILFCKHTHIPYVFLNSIIVSLLHEESFKPLRWYIKSNIFYISARSCFTQLCFRKIRSKHLNWKREFLFI